MANLSAEQIAAVVKAAGMPAERQAVAVAVAFAESSGNPEVVNYLGCVGLWQIYSKVHIKAHPQWTVEWLKVPANNAAAMMVLSDKGTNWKPWSAYTNGSYLIHMAKATAAVNKVANLKTVVDIDGSPVKEKDGLIDKLNPLSGMEGALGTLTSAATWKRVGMVIGGIVLCMISLYSLLNVGTVAGKAAGLYAKRATGGIL